MWGEEEAGRELIRNGDCLMIRDPGSSQVRKLPVESRAWG